MGEARLRSLTCGRRKSNTRSPQPEVLIFCNGQATEKNYLEALIVDKRLYAARIKVLSSEYNRLSLVKEAVNYLKDNPVAKDGHVWLVFDVDALPKGATNVESIKQQVDQAQQLCGRKGFRHAISNDCFEYWLLLHFQYLDAHLHRDDLMKKLGDCLGKSYDKSDEIYELIKDKTALAKKHAAKVACTYDDTSRISCCGPYTGMHKLVEFLEAISRKNGSR